MPLFDYAPMKLIVVSKNDTASLNIAENLLDLGDWRDEGEFFGNPLRKYEDFLMATINDEHLSHDGLDQELREAAGIEPEVMIFASRHKSASELKSFTVHTPGNFTKAEMGGKSGELVPSSPRYKTNALRNLKELGKNMEHTVSYEATHHGPYLETPAFYIEIGSDETCWVEGEAGRIIAEAILALDSEMDPVAVGIGGGHYAPRHTDVALKNRLCFGHIIANYALESITEEMLGRAIDKTPEAEYVYFHRKAMKKSQHRELKAWFEDRGLQAVSQKDIPSRL
jgi:D-aminoacyl-tRNA deacylase